jgi:uncharacterized protein
MNPRTDCVAALLLVGIVLAWPAAADPLVTYILKIKNHKIRVETAANEEERLRGLMYRERLGPEAGMIFKYATSGPASMWMKNTRIPLSVAFIDARGKILNIDDMTPFSEQAHSSKGDAAYALETNLGWFRKRGIGAGEKVFGLDQLPPAK